MYHVIMFSMFCRQYFNKLKCNALKQRTSHLKLIIFRELGWMFLKKAYIFSR